MFWTSLANEISAQAMDSCGWLHSKMLPARYPSAYLCAFPRRTGEPSCFSRRLPSPAHGLCTCASHISARCLIAGICAGSAVIASRNCVGRAVLAFHLRLKSRISRSRQMRSWASAASTFMRHRAFNDLQVLSNGPTRVPRFNPALLICLRRNRDARLRRATRNHSGTQDPRRTSG